jgi:uncharacterized YigZ family protein
MMIKSDEYRTIATPAVGNFRDKGSRFLSFIYPVSDLDEIKQHLVSLKSKYYDATHHCYAWILGDDKSVYRMNDDGEPSGSAGRPIYGQILSHDLTNVLVVVVRYYGGTKLGVPGLINAYRVSAKEAILASGIIIRIVHYSYEIQFEYPKMNAVMKVLKDNSAEVLSTDFGEQCKLSFAIPRMQATRVVDTILTISGVRIDRIA